MKLKSKPLFFHTSRTDHKTQDDLVYFENYVKNVNPFFYDKKSTFFLQNLFKRLAKQRSVVSVNQGATWFRAQKLCDGYIEFDATRMSVPPPEKAIAGRVAPAGVPVLYMANKIENAIFEMRPKPNEKIQVACFIINKSLSILNFDVLTNEQKACFKDRIAVDESISARFSGASENPTDYLLTQAISMYARFRGYDGITYSGARIKKEQGRLPVTLALFDPNHADLPSGNANIYIDFFNKKCEWLTRINEYILTQQYEELLYISRPTRHPKAV